MRRKIKENENIVEKRPIHLYRFYNAKILHLSIDNTESTETTTFEFFDPQSGRMQTRWCYYDHKKYRNILREAIESDKRANILVKRYFKKCKIKGEKKKTENAIEEWIEDVTLIVRT